jgi:uncharacterized membrane protein
MAPGQFMLDLKRFSGTARRVALEQKRADALAVALLLLLSLVASLLIYSLPTHSFFDIGASSTLSPYLEGFTDPETNESYTYAFSTRDTVIRLPSHTASNYRLSIRMSGWRPEDAPPARISLRRGGTSLGVFDVRPEPSRYHVLVPGEDSTTRLRWLSTMFRAGEEDPRMLGIAVDWIEVQSLGEKGKLWEMSHFCLLILVGYGMLRGRAVQPLLALALAGLVLLPLVGALVLVERAANLFAMWVALLGFYGASKLVRSEQRLPLALVLSSALVLLLAIVLAMEYLPLTTWVWVGLLVFHVALFLAQGRRCFQGTTEQAFLFVSLLSGMLMLIVTPPFQIADENTHFLRAYHVSKGNMAAENHAGDNQSGGIFPVNLLTLTGQLTGDIPFRPHNKQSVGNIISFFAFELEPENTRFNNYYSSMYPPMPYIPAALTLAVGRTLELPPLVLFYLGRFTNLLTSVLLIALAIRVTPYGKWVLFLTALIPVTIFQRSSLSADTVTITFSFLLIAFFLWYAFGDQPSLRRQDILILAVLTLCLALSKPPYFLLILLYFLIPVRKVGTRWRYIALFALLVVLTGVCLSIWSFATSDLQISLPTEPSVQVESILSNPLRFAWLVVYDYSYNAWSYLATGIGVLGWLDTSMPSLFTLSYAGMLLAVALIDSTATVRIDIWHRLVMMGVWLLILGSISAALYITWTPVGKDVIAGIHGRYFIPALPLFLLVLNTQAISLDRATTRLPRIVIPYSFVSLVVTLLVIVDRYYVSFLL